MSLKENIDMVKEELNSEEKFFEKAVMTERFVKKYKNAMIASVVAVVVLVGANITYTLNKQNTIEAANATLLALESDASNAAALSRLQSLSPSLYDVWTYSQAVADKNINALTKLKDSKTTLIGDLSTYELASRSKDVTALEAYALKQNSIYKDLALIQMAVILMNDAKVDEAHKKLAQISVQSPLAQVANALAHYGVK